MIESRKILLDNYKEQYNSYENSITITVIADKETAERLRCNIGEKYTQKPPPQTKEKTFERLENYESMRIFFALVEIFNEKYSVNLKTFA